MGSRSESISLSVAPNDMPPGQVLMITLAQILVRVGKLALAVPVRSRASAVLHAPLISSLNFSISLG